MKIKVGDKIKIKEPYMFDRCGYPLTIAMAKDIIIKEHGKDIAEFMKKLGIPCNYTDIPFLQESRKWWDNARVGKLINAIAYNYVNAKGHGGRERQIFTNYDETYKDDEFTVIGKFSKWTGLYYGPSGGYDSWTGEYEYEPGGLHNSKHHNILKLGKRVKNNIEYWITDDLFIEDIHCEKIEKGV